MLRPSPMLEKITARADGYELTIVDEDGGKETIVPDDIDMTMEIDKGHLEDLLDGQNGFTWIGRLFSPKDYTMDNMITYDAQKLGEKIQNLACVQNPDVTPTQNATYAYEDQKFVVVDEVYGNQIDQAVLAIRSEKPSQHWNPRWICRRTTAMCSPQLPLTARN